MISVLMKLSTVMSYCTGFPLLAVLAMLCATISHIYARDETWKEERFKDPNPDRVSADEIREKNRPILNNVGLKLEIEKRLSALEKRYAFFCFLAYWIDPWLRVVAKVPVLLGCGKSTGNKMQSNCNESFLQLNCLIFPFLSTVCKTRKFYTDWLQMI